jgi:hypothetical protein
MKNVFCKKKKCWYKTVLFPAFALFFILAFASPLCPTASAGVYGDGCTYDNWYNGTIHGGIYFQVKGHYDDPGVTQTYTFENVPEGREIVRLYPGIWLGSPQAGRVTYWDITINGHTDSYSFTEPDSLPFCSWDATPEGSTPEGTGCKVSCTGNGVCSITYNASPYIVTGTNTISYWTSEQIYHVALLVIYESESMPEIQYWVKEGGQIYLDESFYEYFNETVNTGRIYTGSIESVKFWLHGHPHCVGVSSGSGFPTFNGNDIDAPDHVYSYDATGNVYEGLPPGKEYTVFARWDNIPPDYINSPSNGIYFPNLGNDRLMTPVLMLNYSEPSELNVTDISPESLCIGWYNTIDATIVNRGGTARLFNATLYADGEVVDVKPVSNLGEGESTTVKFLWLPGAIGSYVLNVTADVENIIKETDKTNNSKTVDVEVKVASPPEWQSQSSSVPEIPEGGTIELRAQGRADVGLDRAILATDETGSWKNITDGRYGSPVDMASCYFGSFTHSSEYDWKAQTLDNLSVIGEDVKLYRMVGTTNLALNQPAYASSQLVANYGPERAVDGGASSYPWVSNGSFPAWWYVDLGSIEDVQQIKIDFADGWGEPYKYTVDISDNAADWTTKIDKSVGKDETYDNLGWSCRYIRVNVTDALGGADYVAIAEFEAYGIGDYKPSGTLTSKTVASTDHPIVAVTPTWNSTEPVAGTSLSASVSVDNGATWKTANNGEELTWDYDVLNNKLKYKVLFETTDVNETPVLHDITLNYKTRDPIEGTWLWSNFTWHNDSIPEGTTVAWKIYYEDMLGRTNCTDVKTFEAGKGGVPNVVVTVHNTSFGNVLAGDNTTIYISLTMDNNEGTGPATIEAVFKTNVSEIYGLNGTGIYIIPGNYFELGPDGSEKALTDTTTKTFISTLPAGEIVTYNAILTVPAGQAADDYSGIVELSW